MYGGTVLISQGLYWSVLNIGQNCVWRHSPDKPMLVLECLKHRTELCMEAQS